jgi:flavin-dependent thymidylate synthase
MTGEYDSMAKVILAGYNVDKVLLDEIKAALREGRIPQIDPRSLTPETLSAAYARISRDPREVTALREESRREFTEDGELKAGQLNTTIVFGMGHQSVSEHAYLNFDILGISRLAIEFLENHRLASYTEKSQRYITMTPEDFVMPQEFIEMGLQDRVLMLIQEHTQLYLDAYENSLLPHVLRKYEAEHGSIPQKMRRILEGSAKEDARYDLSMMTSGQLGMSVNARELEKIIREGEFHPLAEVRDLTRQLYEQARQIAPDLIPLTNPVDYEKNYGTPVDSRYLRDKAQSLADANAGFFSRYPGLAGRGNAPEIPPLFIGRQKGGVELVHYSSSAQARVIEALLRTTQSMDHHEALQVAGVLLRDGPAAAQYMMTLFRSMGKHDDLPREFELAELEFDVTMSSSCYAQMKRHRMMTLLPHDYDPRLGVTIPASVAETGLEDRYRAVLEKGSRLFYDIRDANPAAAPYVLSNAHRRRVTIGVNVRELYAISRLRQDAHAQWDIRGIANHMVELAREVYPLLMLYAGGKDTFDEMKARVDGTA